MEMPFVNEKIDSLRTDIVGQIKVQITRND
jgi:hypothetical protein